MNLDYVQTVALLLTADPAVFGSGMFGMKGGTALNLFVQDMPRLSVDIDLAFVDFCGFQGSCRVRGAQCQLLQEPEVCQLRGA